MCSDLQAFCPQCGGYLPDLGVSADLRADHVATCRTSQRSQRQVLHEHNAGDASLTGSAVPEVIVLSDSDGPSNALSDGDSDDGNSNFEQEVIDSLSEGELRSSRALPPRSLLCNPSPSCSLNIHP